MATEHFCLRWNNHQSTLVSVFDNLLESGTLVDCTLAADGRYLKAHKVVLSACSPYLGMLLSQHYDKHPIIILKDVKFEELKAMLDYMYRGEVNISQEQLSTFLKAAETLQIKGLTDAGSDEGNGLQPNRPPSSNSTTSANEDPQSPGPPGEGASSPCPRKRRRNKHGDDGEGDSASKVSLSEGSDRLSGTSVGSPVAKSASVKREPADGEGDGQMSVDDSGEVVMMSRPGPSNGGTNNKAPWILSADSSGEEMQLTPGQAKPFVCARCGRGYSVAYTLERHMRYECGVTRQFECHLCSRKFTRADILRVHMRSCHRDVADTHGRPRSLEMQHHEVKQEVEDPGSGSVLKEELKQEIKQELDPLEEEINSWEKENRSNQNAGMVYAMAQNEDELIIPEPLEEPTLLVGHMTQNYYQSPAKSVFTTTQGGEDKSERSNGGSQHFKDSNNCDQFVQGVPSAVKQFTVEISAKEESLNRVQDHLKNKRVGIVPKSSYTNFSKSPSSVTVDSGDNSQTRLTRPPQVCLRSASHASSPVKRSKTVVDVADAFDKRKVKVKKTELEFQRKYRKILPAPEDSSCSLTPSAMSSDIEKQFANPSSPQCPTSPSNTSSRNVVETPACVQQNTSNHQQTQGGLMTNTSLTPSVLSIPQQIQVGQIRNPNPSLFSIPQQLQGSQIINNKPNVLSIPQHVQSSQMNNPSTAVLSIAPQFSMSPIQAGNIRMQFSNSTNLQAGNFQHAQFFTNTSASQNKVGSSQNSVLAQQAQAISHPVFVASNIISSCQTSNQFLPSTSVHYNFSTAQPSVQPDFSVPTSQPDSQASQPSIIPSTLSSTASTQASQEHSFFVRTPGGFVRARLPSEGNQAQNTQFVRGNTTFSSLQGRGPSQRGRGRLPPPQRPLLLPKPKPILPKK